MTEPIQGSLFPAQGASVVGAGEHYLPIHVTDLVTFLGRQPELNPQSSDSFRQLTTLILAIEHHLYRQRHQRLLYAYAPLDPDLEGSLGRQVAAVERPALAAELRESTRELLRRANYRSLSMEEINDALSQASQWGIRMRANFQLHQWLEVYVRGRASQSRRRRDWRSGFRAVATEVPLYQRLVVIFRPGENHPQPFDSQFVYLRMFKNVPRHDLEMMLPGTGIQMTWLDHSKIVLPSLYTAGITMWRILKSVFVLALFGVFKTVGIVLLAAIAIAYGVKNMFTFRLNTQRRYLLSMTQSLYFQNLGNNAGVLLRLLEEGEQQEAGEAIVAYFVLRYRCPAARSLDDIGASCADLIHQATGARVDFDARGTLDRLRQLGLVHQAEQGWSALPLAEAIAHLDQRWDAWFDVASLGEACP